MPMNFSDIPSSTNAQKSPTQKPKPEPTPTDTDETTVLPEPDAVDTIDAADHSVPLASETTTIHVIDESTAPETAAEGSGLIQDPPKFPRRAFIGFAAGLVAVTAGLVVYRMLPKSDDIPAADADATPTLANDPGAVPAESDDGTYTVDEDLEAGIYVVECADAADAGWLAYQNPDAGSPLTWPAVPQSCRVTVSVQEDGTTLTLDGNSRFVEAVPTTDLTEIPTHAGLFLVGTDIQPGTYELTPMTANDFCETEFGDSAPVDDDHPTLWHKTCARAASATRAAGFDIEQWRGYVLEEPKTAGDVSCVLEDGSPANIELLTDDSPTVGIVGTIETDNTMDSYLAWLVRHGLTQAAADETVEVELTEGQVFAPVMMSMKRKG